MKKGLLASGLAAVIVLGFLLPISSVEAVSGYGAETWTIATLDSGGNVGIQCSIATDALDKVHISYADFTNNDLKHATNAGGSWAFYTLDSMGDVGLHTSIATDSDNNVHIGYWDFANEDLKYATNADGSWACYTLDSLGWVGREPSIAVDANNKVHISYDDDTNSDLKYATNADGSWAYYTLDSMGSVGYYSSIAVDSSNHVHISYEDGTNNDLKYATNAGGSWACYTLDSLGQVGGHSSIAVDSDNNVHISYYDETNGDLKYATNLGGFWAHYTLDGLGNVGEHTSIATDTNNKVHISYYDETNGDLKYATNADGSWVYETVDSTEDVGGYTSIVVDSSDNVHISYYDSTKGDLKYATNAGTPSPPSDAHDVLKGAKGPSASAVTWEYVPSNLGTWTGHIVNNGLRSLVVDVYDNTTGMLVQITHQRIRFAAQDAFPTGTVITMGVMMSPIHKYLVTVTPNGPRGSGAVVTDLFHAALPPVASFTYVTDHLLVSVDGTGSYDPDGEVVEWSWDWGDGSTGDGMMTSHTYGGAGTYIVTLLVTDDIGLSDTNSVQIPVEVGPAEFSPPHSDHGFDSDSDGLYDYLVVDVSLSMSTAGYYSISAWLYGPYDCIVMGGNSTYLDSGLQTMEILFGGYRIHSSGFDGPYYVFFRLYDEMGNLLESDWYTTQVYTWTQFQTPPAELAPPHSDQGLDADGDGLYDYLVVDVSLSVSTAGYYGLNVNLYDLSWNYVGWTSNYTYLDSGLRTVKTLIEGPMIFSSGFDGPYVALIDLSDAGNGLDSEYYTTQAYTWNQFQSQLSYIPAIPITKGAADNTGVNVMSLTTCDGWTYQVAAQMTMEIDSWDVGTLADEVLLSSATLVVTYAVDSTYQGNDPVLRALEGGVLASTQIVPSAGDGFVERATYDLNAAGVTTVGDVRNLDIKFTNTGTAGTGSVQFDKIWIVMSLC